tara:strand:+ start:3473 stop:6064 length:2592 start_codon:yes stop_codon:yes gene_type:complete
MEEELTPEEASALREFRFAAQGSELEQQEIAAFRRAANPSQIRDFAEGVVNTGFNMGAAVIESMGVRNIDPSNPSDEPIQRRKVQESLGGRSGAVTAESLAVGLPIAGLATRVPRSLKPAGTSVRGFGQNVVSDIGTQFRTKPLRFAATEATLGALSGGGGFIAEELFPDTPAARFMGELVGGFTPAGATAMLTALGRKLPIAAWMTRQVQALTQRTSEGNFGSKLQDRVDRATPDRQGALDAMDEDLIDGLTPAAKTGDIGLLELEKAANASLPDSQRFIDNAVAQTQINIREAVARFAEDLPDATRQTFIDAQQEMIASLDARLLLAARQADELIEGFSPNVTREQANQIVANELDGALKIVRQEESRLYALIPQDAATPTGNSTEAYANFVNELSSAQKDNLPIKATEFLSRGSFNDKGVFVPNPKFLGEETTIKELRGLQSELRQEARNARAGKDANFNRARIADDLANAITEDIALTQGGEGVSGAVEIAVAHSRALNEKFRQGTVGDLLGYTAQGDVRTQGGLVLEQSLGLGGANGSNARVAFDDIMNAVDGNPAVRGAMDEFIRNKFQANAMRNGELNVGAANSFMRANREALNRMPETRDAIQAVIDSGDAASVAALDLKSGKASLSPNQNIATVFIKQAPERAFGRVLVSSTPETEMAELVMLAGRDQTGRASQGLKSSFSDYVLSRATEGANLSGVKINAFLNNPQTRKAMEVLYTTDELARWETIGRTLDRLDLQRSAPASPEGITGEKPNRLIEFLAGYFGARAGRALNTGTIQVPAQTASLFRTIIRQGLDPLKATLVRSVQDEKFFREVLMVRMPKDGAIPQQAGRRLNAFLGSLLVDFDDEQDQQEQQ